MQKGEYYLDWDDWEPDGLEDGTDDDNWDEDGRMRIPKGDVFRMYVRDPETGKSKSVLVKVSRPE